MKTATKASLLLVLPALVVSGAELYRKPPKAVLDVLNSPVTPTLTINPTRTFAMQGQPVRYPPIAELAQPMLRIAGMRINPKTNGLHNTVFNSSLTLRKIPDGTEIKVDLPANAKLTIDGYVSKQTSSERRLVTVPIAPDREFTYTLVAEVNGAQQAQTVTVRAGQTMPVNFNFSTQPTTASR